MIDNVTRDTVPITGFERVKFRDVPDVGPRANVEGSPKKKTPLAPLIKKQRDLFEEFSPEHA
jgi:hypothetical protein